MAQMQRAGVAITKLSGNVHFSITRIDGAPFTKTIHKPTHGSLSLGGGVTPAEVVETLSKTVRFDTDAKDNGFCVALPIVTGEDVLETYGAPGVQPYTHLHAFLNGPCMGPRPGRGKNIIFVDLTPGQVAANLAHGIFRSIGHWGYLPRGVGHVVLEEVQELTVQDVVDKLILPLLSNPPKHLDWIGILRPQGAFPDISCTALEARFPDIPIQWVTLDDLSHGAALAATSIWRNSAQSSLMTVAAGGRPALRAYLESLKDL